MKADINTVTKLGQKLWHSTLKKHSEEFKKRFEDPEYRKKHSETQKRVKADPEYRKRQSEIQKKIQNTLESRKRNSEAQKKRYVNPDERERARQVLKKRLENPETRKKMSGSAKKRFEDSDARREQGEKLRKRFEDPQFRKKHSETQRARFADPETRKKDSDALKKYYADHRWYGSIKYYDGPQYCEKWTAELRERVRAYFGYVCAECGTPQTEKKLAVHHVHYNKRLCCDDTPRTLVPLCTSCHAKTNSGNREYWSNHYQDIIDSYYDGKCWFTKEEMKQYLLR